MPTSVGPAAAPAQSAAVASIIASLEQALAREYPPGSTVRRDAHPKHHGLVQARLEVDATVPPDLRHGVFASPTRYDAWVRFSNGSPCIRPDTKKDQRGLALKLFGVPGEKLLDDERDAVTQDFLLATAPRFFIRDSGSYADFASAAVKEPAIRVLGYFLGWNPFAWRLHELRALAASLVRTPDLLGARYWSQVPFRLGPHVVKYSLRPLDPSPYEATGSTPGFLRERLAERLAAADARFELLAQRFVDEARTPIEDATIDWPEREAPFERVAVLVIPSQEFRSPARDALAEQLSFTPWHALPAHEPVGGVNRIRRDVYRAISRYRHTRNGVVRQEPTHLETAPCPS
jgi:catalase